MDMIDVIIMLNKSEAHALALLVKRIGWQEIRQNAKNEEQAYLMPDALYQLQKALAENGYNPR